MVDLKILMGIGKRVNAFVDARIDRLIFFSQ